MKSKVHTYIITASLLCTGCSHTHTPSATINHAIAKEPGLNTSPTGNTKASPETQKGIISFIERIETEFEGHTGTPKIDEIRLLPDGREAWIIHTTKKSVAYTITIKPSEKGEGSDFGVTGPTEIPQNR